MSFFFKIKSVIQTILVAFLFISFLTSVSTVYAAEKYISPSGSDSSGNGTSSLPYFSLQKALQGVQPGDTIYVNSGTYVPTQKEQFFITNVAGTADNPVVIRSLSGARPVFSAQQANYAVSEGVVTFSNSSHVQFIGIEVDATFPSTGKRMRGVTVNSSAQHILLENLKVTNSFQKGVGLSGQHIIFRNSEVTNTSLNNQDASLDLAQGSGWEQAVSTYLGADDIIIENNYIHSNWGEGIDVILGKNVKIRGNILHDNYSVNIYVDTGRDVTIEKNITYRTTDRFDRRRRSGGNLRANSITLANELNNSAFYINNITIRENILGLGNRRGINYFQLEGGYGNVVIENNTILGQTDEAVFFESASSVSGANRVANNIVYGVQGKPVIDIDSGLQSWTFSMNSWPTTQPTAFAVSSSDITTSPGITFQSGPSQGPQQPFLATQFFQSYSPTAGFPQGVGAVAAVVGPVASASPSPSPVATPSLSPSPSSDNTCRSIRQDVNRDGTVNLLDYAAVLEGIKGNDATNPNLDVVQDNKINLLDLADVIANLMRACPQS
jgi:hypothetical protein